MTYYDIYDVLGCGGLRTQQVSQDNIKTNAHKTENNTKCKEAFGDTVGVDYDVLSHYWKYIFCENSDVRGFILSS